MLYFFNNKTKLYTCVWVAPEKKYIHVICLPQTKQFTSFSLPRTKLYTCVQFAPDEDICRPSVCPKSNFYLCDQFVPNKAILCSRQNHLHLFINAIYMRSVCPQTKPYTCVQVAPKQSHINASSWSKQGAPVPQQVKRWPTGLLGLSPT